MTQLIAKDGTEWTLPLEEFAECILGSDPEQCQVVIAKGKVPARSLLFRKEKRKVFVRNLDEKLPLMLNGKNCDEETSLKEGDLLSLGKEEFRFSRKKAKKTVPKKKAPAKKQATVKKKSPPKKAKKKEQKSPRHTLFDEEALLDDLPQLLITESRCSLRMLSGGNAGAEFPLEAGKSYLLGSDPQEADIVLQDVSVSRKQLELRLDKEHHLFAKDLGSHNGSFLDEEKLSEKTEVLPYSILSMGRSSFTFVDREVEAKTLTSPLFSSKPPESDPIPLESKEKDEEDEILEEIPKKKKKLSSGAIIFLVILSIFFLSAGLATHALFREEPVVIHTLNDRVKEIRSALRSFPEVRFDFNASSGKLFLLGHLNSRLQMRQLKYHINNLSFVDDIVDNIVVDELVWKEINQTLAWNSLFKGIRVHSPRPGKFTLTGTLNSKEEAATLNEYISLNFPHLDRLDNQVIVREELLEEVHKNLNTFSFSHLQVELLNSTLTLRGAIDFSQASSFEQLLAQLEELQGVRELRNLVRIQKQVARSAIDISDRYDVTGHSSVDAVQQSIVINGKILSRGDILDGMTVVSITPKHIFLEQGESKYRIDYNS